MHTNLILQFTESAIKSPTLLFQSTIIVAMLYNVVKLVVSNIPAM